LNETQLEAVKWQDGPLLVVAGPGSGKTRVLTYRIARIIDESSDKNFRILGLTFTNKAATEMRKRIEALVPNANQRTLLTTFHSFAGDVLRQHGHMIGLKPDFTIISQDGERIALLDEAVNDVSSVFDVANYNGERLLPVVNRLLDLGANEQTVSSLLATLPSEQQGGIGAIYVAYRRKMIANNSLDFGGLIAEALELLRSRPAVKKQIQRVYNYICVDEFQDTNRSQYEILMHLVNPSTKNLFVVADDDQIIYQWNGANPERLVSLKNDFGMTELQLPANYRCPPQVIDLANNLILHNTNRALSKKQLQAQKQAIGNAVQLKHFSSFTDEADWVAKDIERREPKDRACCVVLARTRKLLDLAIQAFEKLNVPAYLAMRKDEFVSDPLCWVHASLRLANSQQDREQLRRLCKAFYAIEGIQIDAKDVVSSAATSDGNFLRAFVQVALLRRESLKASTVSILEKTFSKLIDKLDYNTFLAETFLWLDEMQDSVSGVEDDLSEYPDEKATWLDLQSEIASQYGGQDQVTLHILLQELDMRSKAPKPPAGAVPCFTIHASKGMEFVHVYLIGLVEDQLPSWGAVKKGDHSHEMQEERRNCFVAITRTEETLTLSYSDKVFGYIKRPSRFLREMGLIA
jgi:DNA helicase-2/ATP-dependent DNA helicase PcrA